MTADTRNSYSDSTIYPEVRPMIWIPRDPYAMQNSLPDGAENLVFDNGFIIYSAQQWMNVKLKLTIYYQ